MPFTVEADAKYCTDPNNNPQDMNYSWSFSPADKAFVMKPHYTYVNPGAYTIKLYVNDGEGGTDSTKQIILVSDDESKSFRFDFGQSDRSGDRAPGYTSVGIEQYTPHKGYGFARADSGLSVSTYREYHNELVRDYIELDKYNVPQRYDGEFIVDLPNGWYSILAGFGHRQSISFEKITAEGKDVAGKIGVKGMKDGVGTTVQSFFTCLVEDGQLNLRFHRHAGSETQWFISSLDIIPGKYAIQEHAVGVVNRPPRTPVVAKRVVEMYDVRGRKISPNHSLALRRAGTAGAATGLYLYRAVDAQSGRVLETGKSLLVK